MKKLLLSLLFSLVVVIGFASFTFAQLRQPTKFDFDGDGKADLSVFRPETGFWYIQGSRDGFTASQFGVSTDKIVPADYDGDGKTDIAVYRPSDGAWYIQKSKGGFFGIAFGVSTDIAQPADYSGDGIADIAVFRPSNGTWYFYNLINNQFTAFQFGQEGDIPVAADYDGDGKTDVAVVRNGIWYIQQSRDGFTGLAFGQPGDALAPADYDGDGKTNPAFFRNGVLYYQGSAAGFDTLPQNNGGFSASLNFNAEADRLIPADYDGDGKADLAIFKDKNWIFLKSSDNHFVYFPFGLASDIPVPNAFIR